MGKPAAYRRSPKRDLRNRIIKRDYSVCRYCGFFIKEKDQITIDHIHPYSKGGLTIARNLVVACKTCNMFKGDRTIYEAGMKIIPYRLIRRLRKQQVAGV